MGVYQTEEGHHQLGYRRCYSRLFFFLLASWSFYSLPCRLLDKPHPTTVIENGPARSLIVVGWPCLLSRVFFPSWWQSGRVLASEGDGLFPSSNFVLFCHKSRVQNRERLQFYFSTKKFWLNFDARLFSWLTSSRSIRLEKFKSIEPIFFYFSNR